MGAVNSCCIPRSESERGANTSTPKEKGHRRNLSATFNMSIIENANATSNLVNVNTATEEELMTLPGVNRLIAKSIVDYRSHIGGFRRVDDLALTPGVGATKLAVMRNEIYVDSPVVDDSDEAKQNLISQDESDTGSAPAVCINSANIFRLLMVKGIGMTIAKNIVAYREKHGKYKKVDELLKVKDIGLNNFETMRPFLTVEDKNTAISEIGSTKNGNCMNGIAGLSATEQEHLDQEYVLRSKSSIENLLEILGPLAKVPERPKMGKVMLKHKNRPVFRLASWNLDKFSLEKARNPGVKDVVCMVILENGFGIVALQELSDHEALNEICRELNSPTLPNVRKWTGRRGRWACVVSEGTSDKNRGKQYQGFLYDKSQNIELIKSSLLKVVSGSGETTTSKPFLGTFKITQGLHFTLVNVHLKTGSQADEGLNRDKADDKANRISEIISAVRQEIKGEKHVIILGDFNQNQEATEAFDDLRKEGYVQCVQSVTTESSSQDGMSCGNIWINKEVQTAYSGVSEIVRDGLSSTWIPNGWSWGNVVSSDCPVFAQLYCSKDLKDCADIPPVTFH